MRVLLSTLVVSSMLLLGADRASAHPLAPSVLSFEPHQNGTVTMTWRSPAKRPTGQSLRPRIPESCTPLGPADTGKSEDGTTIFETVELRCNRSDMLGAVVRVDGFEDSSMNVVVRIARADGSVDHAILDRGMPELHIMPPDQRSHSFSEYLRLGVEHLLTGWDHLTFVIGLLILFGWHRRLIAAITAFTLGHSLTLALSVLGIVRVPQMAVEALIALTIVVLALEIQSGRHGLVWRHPWTLPGSLGLLHGLGFASVLFDAGLPAGEVPLALLGFNLGLELGQLVVISFARAAFVSMRGLIPPSWRAKPTIPAYVIGSLAAFWVIERTVAAFGLSS
ncbi:MAG: HupE/UreJ family protein [Myxococcales bacterium]|jgi:hydrogenase/urease accessory protein HupE